MNVRFIKIYHYYGGMMNGLTEANKMFCKICGRDMKETEIEVRVKG